MRYLSVAETAKLIRVQLKKNFPGVKFSVRSSSYAGGASITVGWTDGPTSKAVDAVTDPFSSRGFDGMIDMAYCKTSYLLPDGSVTYGRSDGTQGSMGTVAAYENELPDGAEEIRFGSNYVFTHRVTTPKALLAGLTAVVEKFGNQIGLPENLADAIKESDYDGAGYLDRAFSDKDVTGEPGWNLHWSLGSQVSAAVQEMTF